MTDITETAQSAFALQSAGINARRQNFGTEARREALAQLGAAIHRNEAAIIAAMASDFGKPEAEVILTEIIPVLQEIRHTSRHLRRWMRPRRVAPTLVTLGTTARIKPEARGVCLIIAPWNYPFSLAIGPLVSALAAGNSVIIKPSEMTPATSALITQLITQTFAPDLVTVVEGGVDASQALLALPFDHIFFTGSPEVGKIVMAAASKTLASVTLELGGEITHNRQRRCPSEKCRKVDRVWQICKRRPDLHRTRPHFRRSRRERRFFDSPARPDHTVLWTRGAKPPSCQNS